MSGPPGELSAVEVGYVRAGRVILADVTLTAYAGEAVAVTGPSGSGKSSLLALLAGLERPTSGVVRLAGAPVWPGGPTLRQRYGLILQGYGLVSVLTAAENVELVLQARGLAAAEVLQRAQAMLDLVGMAEVADHLVEELSGGQQQRVAVARALVANPEVVLADEPTAELDAGNRERILGLLLAEARRGRIVMLASHDREVADACDREFRLVDGRLAAAEPSPPYAEDEEPLITDGFAPDPILEPAAQPPLPPEPAAPPVVAAEWRRPSAADRAERADGDRPRTTAGSGWERPRAK